MRHAGRPDRPAEAGALGASVKSASGTARA